MHMFIPIDSGRISTKTRSILSCEWVNPNPFIHHVRNFVWKRGCSWIQLFIVIPSKIGNSKIWAMSRVMYCIHMDCEKEWNIMEHPHLKLGWFRVPAMMTQRYDRQVAWRRSSHRSELRSESSLRCEGVCLGEIRHLGPWTWTSERSSERSGYITRVGCKV